MIHSNNDNHKYTDRTGVLYRLMRTDRAGLPDGFDVGGRGAL